MSKSERSQFSFATRCILLDCTCVLCTLHFAHYLWQYHLIILAVPLSFVWLSDLIWVLSLLSFVEFKFKQTISQKITLEHDMAPAHCSLTILPFFVFVSLCPNWQLYCPVIDRRECFNFLETSFSECRQCSCKEWAFFSTPLLTSCSLHLAFDWACLPCHECPTK